MTIPGFGPLAMTRRGADGVITSVDADVGDRRVHVFQRPTSWGILDQEDTRCLFQGIPDLEEPKMWCHWSLRCSDYVMHYQPV